MSRKRITLIVILISLIAGLIWFWLSDTPAIWAVRNSLQYQVAAQWWRIAGEPTIDGSGTLRGVVRDVQGNPIDQAWVLAARYDGQTYKARSDAEGNYLIANIPAGAYRPVVGAPDYESFEFGDWWHQARVRANQETTIDFELAASTNTPVTLGTDLQIGEPERLSCQEGDLPSKATRRQIEFSNEGQPNQLSYYYTPFEAEEDETFPVLFAIYPTILTGWECLVSFPLAGSGYAVVATSPAYSFELEADLDELVQLLEFVRDGQLPQTDGDQIVILGGSYSGVHVQRLLQRREAANAVIMMGGPTDLFEMRFQLEQGMAAPPFGLDQALRALGFPNQEPLRHWIYSGAYHVRSDFPPMLLLHSKTDDIVPYQQSELLAQELATMGVPHQVHIFEGGGHYLLAQDGDEDARKMYDLTLDFLGQHLE